MEFNMVREERRVEVETTFGTVAGLIHCSSSVRTLDDLNFPRADYLFIYEPKVRGAGTRPSEIQGPLAIQKESILFARELSEVPFSLSRGNPEKFWVSVVEYQVGSFVLRGTVHYPPGGEPIARLNQRTHQFLALTAVRITGSGRTFDAPFLAVNRQHLLSAWELDGAQENTAVHI